MRRFFRPRVLVSALVVVLALVACLLVVVTTPWFRTWLRGVVVEQIGAVVEGEFDIARISGSLFRDVTIHQAVLRQNGEIALEVGELSARYDPVQLILGHLTIDELRLVRPRIRLVQDERGWNVTRWLRTRETGPSDAPRAIAIRRLEITDGDVSIQMNRELAAHVRDLNLKGGISTTGTEFEVTDVEGSFREERGGLPVNIAVSRVSGSERTRIEQARIVAPGVTFTGDAAMGASLDTLQVDLRLVLERWTAGSVATYVPVELGTIPALTGNLSVNGTLDAMRTNWTLTSEGGASTGQLVIDGRNENPVVGGLVTATDVNPRAFTGVASHAGRITARLNLESTIVRAAPFDSTVKFDLQGGPIQMQDYRADVLKARGTFERGTLKASADASAYGASASFTATVRNVAASGVPDIAANGRVANLNVARLPAPAGRPDLVSDVTGAFVASVSSGAWRVRFDTDPSTIAGIVIADGALIEADSRGKSLRASLNGDVKNVSTELLAPSSAKPSSLGGHIEASVFLPDTAAPLDLDAIEAEVRATLTDSMVYGASVVSAVIDASVLGGLADVRTLEVQSPALALTAKGRVAVGRNAASPSDFTYELDAPDLEALADLGVSGMRGAAHISGKATGSAEAPAFEGEFNLQQFGYGTTADALAVNGTFDAKIPDLDPANIDATLETTGTFIKVGGQEIRQATIVANYTRNGIDLKTKIDQQGRSIELDGGLAIFPDYREVHLRDMTISGLGDPWRLEPGGETVVRYGTDDVRINRLAFIRGAERLEASGVVGLPNRGVESDLTLSVSNLRVGDLYVLVTGSETIDGTAQAEVRLTGALDKPEVVANLSITDGKVADVPFSTVRADVKLVDKLATVDGRIEEPTGSALTVNGTVPTSADAGPLDLRVQSSTISLGLLQGVTEHVADVTGTALIDVQVSGSLASPAVAGAVQIADGAFRVTPTGVAYRDVVLDLKLDGSRANVERASLTDSNGNTLTMSGTGDVLTTGGAARAIDVQIESKGIQVLDNPLGDVALTIDARARGTVQAPQLDGRITVDRGRLEVDELLRELGGGSDAPLPEETSPVPTASDTPDSPAEPAPAPAPAPVASEDSGDAAAEEPEAGAGTRAQSLVNLEISLPDNVVLRGSDIRQGGQGMGLGDLNMTVGGNVAVRKEADTPLRVVGAVEVVRGFYEFQGRRFDVERGSTLRFRGTDTINPALDVTGEREVSGIVARVNVQGTARRPVLNLSSDPPLPEGDVLSLIIFNQPMSQLGRSEQVDLADRAGNLALGMIATTLADSIGRALDVDLFELRAPSSDEAGQLSVGTQVSERLFVGFRQEFGSNDASRLSFEYRLTEALRLLTSVGQGADRTTRTRDRETAGLDLIYRIKY